MTKGNSAATTLGFSDQLRHVRPEARFEFEASAVSLQWLFENEPALESDLDVVAYVAVINPDGVPGTGDERFRTVTSGGTKLVLGSSEARKDKVDTIVRTALVIKF